MVKIFFFILDHFLHFQCDMGDWFVLHQISKNVDFYYFNQFINHLISEEINGKFINGIEDRVGSKKHLTRECSKKNETGPEICY